MATANEKIADAMIKQGIDLMRVEAALRSGINRRLTALEKELVEQIKRVEPSAPEHLRDRVVRIEALVAQANQAFGNAYGDIEQELEDALTEVVETESRNLVKIIGGLFGIRLGLKILNQRQARSLVRQALVEGAQGRSWWRKQEGNARFNFDRALREAVYANEELSSILRRVRGSRSAGYKDGVMATNRRHATTLTRTLFTSVLNNGRLETYRANADIIKGVQWLAVLDNRTSDICKALDGQAWDLEGNRLPGTVHPFVGPPPAHFNCRSTLIPVMKSWNSLNSSARRDVQRRLQAANLSRPIRTSFDGKLSGDVTYESWLANKDRKNPESVKKILGAGKYKLWKDGDIAFTDLIDQSWNPLTVAQLTRKVSRRK